MADKKVKSGTVRAGDAVSVAESKELAAERAANAQGKTLVEVAPLTSDGSGTAKAKPSSTLPAGKSLNEVNAVEEAKLTKSAASLKGGKVGETVFSKKAAAPKAAAAKAAPKKSAVSKFKAAKQAAKKAQAPKQEAAGSDPLVSAGREA